MAEQMESAMLECQLHELQAQNAELRAELYESEQMNKALKELAAYKQKGLDEMLMAFSGSFMAKELHKRYSAIGGGSGN